MVAGNPILKRELQSLLRSPITVWLAVAYAVTLAAVVLAMWPADSVFARAAQASRTIVVVFAVAQVLLVMLYAPAFTATAITAEKERNSYELLFTTQLTPRAIVAGKLTAAVLCLVVFVLLSFPLFAACFFLGAVSPAEMAGVYLVSVSTALLVGLLGLSVSAWRARSDGALFTSYLLVLALNVGPWIPVWLASSWPGSATALYMVRACSPVSAILALFVPGLNLPASGLPPSWAVYVVFAGLTSLLLHAGLLLVVSRGGERRSASAQRVVVDPRELWKRRLRFPFYLLDPLRRRGHIPRWLNPVFAREMRGKAFGGGVWVLRTAYLCFAASATVMWLAAGRAGQHSLDGVRLTAVVFQLGLVALIVPALTAGAITQERERANLDLLRLTRLGAVRLVLGKLGAVGVFLLFLAGGFAPLWFGFYVLRANTPREILLCWAITGAGMWFALMAGLCSSALSRRTAVAAGLAYGLVLLTSVATLFPALAPERLSKPVADWLLAVNPFAAALQIATSGHLQQWRELWPQHLALMLGGGTVLFLVAVLRVRQLLRPEP